MGKAGHVFDAGGWRNGNEPSHDWRQAGMLGSFGAASELKRPQTRELRWSDRLSIKADPPRQTLCIRLPLSAVDSA
jgi:hypothetical protein